jgi:hypothetical protein
VEEFSEKFSKTMSELQGGNGAAAGTDVASHRSEGPGQGPKPGQ